MAYSVGLKWKIVAALGLSPNLVGLACVERSIVGESMGSGGSGDDGSTSDDDSGSEDGSSTTPLPTTTTPSTTATTDPSTSTSTSDDGSSGVPPPVCVPSDSYYELAFCMPPAANGECFCDDTCQAYANDVWYEQNCCDSCEYVFSETLCAEWWEGQCCYVALFREDWCGKGRPFVVAEEARSAEPMRRSDWIGDVAIGAIAVETTQRRALAEAWVEVGLAEHASVASFGRFVLELAAVGAPADLLADAATALHDEVRHAEVAFAIASRVGGDVVGPGRVPMQGVVPRTDLETVVRAVVREGCIGETLSAAEVELASQRARDGGLARTLAAIASDESRHAVLAWRFVQWALCQDPRLAVAVREEFARACPGASTSRADALPPAIAEAHGHLAPATRDRLRAHTLLHTVLPCAAALLDLGDAFADARA